MQITVGIITISDRAARGAYADQGGPALEKAAQEQGWEVMAKALVQDEPIEIQGAIRRLIGQGCQLILTTGGTGIGLRDVTPEAVRAIAAQELPGFGEAMRSESMRITPHALLSRSLAVVVDRVLVVCLPGKPAGAVECLSAVARAIPHGIDLLRERPAHD